MKIKDVLTHGPLIGSEKIYVPGQLFPELRVGMRRIVLSDTYNEDGSRTPNALSSSMTQVARTPTVPIR